MRFFQIQKAFNKDMVKNKCQKISLKIIAASLKIKPRTACKGQIKPKADWRTIDSPKKQTNE